MPLNYLDLEPQINQYAQNSVELNREIQDKCQIALDLIRECGVNHSVKKEWIRGVVESQPDPPRCALLVDDRAEQSYACLPHETGGYTILASDGSQITPGGHDAVSIALINTSRLSYAPGSGKAPMVDIETKFLFDKEGRIEFGNLSEDLISLRRDVSELEILAKWQSSTAHPVIALGDGPLELFHQPRQGEDFNRFFQDYLDILKSLHIKKMAVAGYTDRPRAALIVKMLEFSVPAGKITDLSRLEDQSLFKQLLKPGERSAIFELRSSSSAKYEGPLALHFFYLNVGSQEVPWIARVEIPGWVASDIEKTFLVHQALLDQCALMGARPYPYILHRAHEEAVVRFEEKERLVNRLAIEIQQRGLGISLPSHKQNAKNLSSRRRIGE